MQLFKRLFGGRQRQLSPDELMRNIHEFSSLVPPKLWEKEMGLIETINAAQREKMTILPNKEVARILMGKKPADECNLIWSGTLVIFEESGKRFGSAIEHSLGMYDAGSIHFMIPKEFQGKEGGALVIHHPYFRLSEVSSDSYELHADLKKLNYMKGFPVRQGRFSIDDFFGLPVEGGEITKQSVFLSLRPFPYIGLVGRSFSEKEMVYTTDPPKDKMCAMVRMQIDPNNYVGQVASLLQNGANRKMIEYARDWAREDPALADALKSTGKE